MKIAYSEGATPLDPNELEGLIPQHLILQAQLNRWEQANILEAELWLSKQKITYTQILQLDFIFNIHKRMFRKTWRWAGITRKSNKNIGIDWQHISIQLKLLLDDMNYQIANATYEPDEICARFHHRLVAIHPFANGNGRHARLVTDKLIVLLNRPRFTWGSHDLANASAVRKKYIAALRSADGYDYGPLLSFVRS